MKHVTISAMLGVLIAIPFIFGREKPEIIPLAADAKQNSNDRETNLRYDVDDFLTE